MSVRRSTPVFGVNQNPFPRYRSFFNIHRIDVISNESGENIPQQGIKKDTALDASYRFDGETNRLLSFSSVKAYLALIDATTGTGIDYNMLVGVVNESLYGGAGGAWAVYAEETHHIPPKSRCTNWATRSRVWPTSTTPLENTTLAMNDYRNRT